MCLRISTIVRKSERLKGVRILRFLSHSHTHTRSKAYAKNVKLVRTLKLFEEFSGGLSQPKNIA